MLYSGSKPARYTATSNLIPKFIFHFVSESLIFLKSFYIINFQRSKKRTISFYFIRNSKTQATLFINSNNLHRHMLCTIFNNWIQSRPKVMKLKTCWGVFRIYSACHPSFVLEVHSLQDMFCRKVTKNVQK